MGPAVINMSINSAISAQCQRALSVLGIEVCRSRPERRGRKWVWNKSPGWSTWTGPLIRAARVKQHVSSTPHPSLPFPNTRFFNVPACFSSLCAQRRHPREPRPNEPHAGQCRGAERAGTPALEKTLQTLKVCWLRCNSLVPKNTCVRHGKETRLFPFGSWQTSIWKIRFIVKYLRILFLQRLKKEDSVDNKMRPKWEDGKRSKARWSDYCCKWDRLFILS